MNSMQPRWSGHRVFQVVLVLVLSFGVVALVYSVVDYTNALTVIARAGQLTLYVFLLSQSIRTRRYYERQG